MPDPTTLRHTTGVLALALWTTVTLAADGAAAGSWCVEAKSVALLKRAGHTPGFICDNGATSFRFVGRITGNAGGYLIYDFEYTYKAAVVRHGGRRLMVFDRKESYLGQYSLSRGDITVAGSSLRLSVPAEVELIDFSRGPPPSIFFDGDVREFYQ